ncbi:DUF429 domain-containing protein [Natronomonas sp.]|uniref:DUF429 domain-containing protein n=1 Tax=Natronomonas sp. TaxID=2184060 RepID=UPI0026175F3C|nr:DUF429 domain-containing protein [Natronomonas sp.]
MHVRGVDFSGSARPGTDIWITEAELEEGRLSISSCRSAADRFDCSARGPVLRELRSVLRGDPGTTGLDVSFGIPARLLPEGTDTWGDAIEWFSTTFDDAGAMRRTLKDRARALSVEGVELKRRTDAAVGANSPYSFITYYQTLYGIRDVLVPLVRADALAVPPMDAPRDRNAIEIYPAGTLRRLETVATTYKDDTEAARRRRERIVERLSEPAADAFDVEIPPSIERTVTDDPGGDALDSVVAAVATARAVANGFEPPTPFDDREGCIYV